MLNMFLSLGDGQTLERHWCIGQSHVDVSKIISATHFPKEEFVFNPKPVSFAESPISSLLVQLPKPETCRLP